MTPTTLPPTETRNPLSMKLDGLSTLQMVQLMNQQDATVPVAIAQVLPQIAQTVDIMAAALAAGHRVFYQGAGTSGRLAVLDAVELLPTFRLEPDRVIPLLAGGDAAMMRSVEGAEDDEALGRADLMRHNFSGDDVLLGVAASGRTPYALGGLHYAAELGARSAALVCNGGSAMAAAAQIAIEVVVGPEVLTGSTRLKAGTAQKLVLNMLSTCTMVKLGKVYENLMVDVNPSNQKLRQRAARIVGEITGVAEEEAAAQLAAADWEVKTAVVMGLLDVSAAAARQRLAAADGHIRRALAE
ncbi:MAG: N-acetylmuramic acid 6-phosphate etherase [Caldilineaceae bacterium]|nr:N-acetylmuramic acid 6-phosphate etherase [Caldilineaceae bacterium]